jgi:hypothetical protein
MAAHDVPMAALADPLEIIVFDVSETLLDLRARASAMF